MGKNNLSRDIGVIICLVGLLQFHQSPQYKQCTPLENSIMTVIQLVQQNCIKAELFEEAKYDFEEITSQRKESILRQMGKTVEVLVDRYHMASNIT